MGGQYAQGYFRHYSPEGKFVQIIYVADENGYQPQLYFTSSEDIRAHATPEELADQQVRAWSFRLRTTICTEPKSVEIVQMNLKTFAI